MGKILHIEIRYLCLLVDTWIIPNCYYRIQASGRYAAKATIESYQFCLDPDCTRLGESSFWPSFLVISVYGRFFQARCPKWGQGSGNYVFYISNIGEANIRTTTVFAREIGFKSSNQLSIYSLLMSRPRHAAFINPLLINTGSGGLLSG